MKYQRNPLKYDYNYLEPYIDKDTVKFHYDFHHKTYETNLNNAIENTEYANKFLNLEDLLLNAKKIQDKNLQKIVINMGGGVHNHNLYWKTLGKKAIKDEYKIAQAIKNTFNSINEFKENYKKFALSLFGSGWTWLVVNKKNELEIITTPNQNSPLIDNLIPILGCDVWEHAYYLKYQNRRNEYFEAWWQALDWEAINNIFLNVK